MEVGGSVHFLQGKLERYVKEDRAACLGDFIDPACVSAVGRYFPSSLYTLSYDISWASVEPNNCGDCTSDIGHRKNPRPNEEEHRLARSSDNRLVSFENIHSYTVFNPPLLSR